MGSVDMAQGNPRGAWENASPEIVTISLPYDEWVRFQKRVELMVSVLSSVVSSLQMTPFGGMISPETVAKIAEVDTL